VTTQLSLGRWQFSRPDHEVSRLAVGAETSLAVDRRRRCTA
jgi:hypothetical protein